MRSLCLLLLTVFIISALAHKHPLDRFGNIKVPCATEDVYEQRHERARTCATRGPCDGEAYRDQHGNTQNIITINTAVHVMRSNQGESPDGVGQAQVDTMMDRLNQYYGAYGITFQTSTYYHNNNTYFCIPAYSGTNPAWSEAIDDMKKEYAVNAASTLNIFISCQKSSLQGTLFGIATFPWDTKALTSTGGLWLNSIAVDDEAQANGDITLEHEMGHCLGLWHTFHGSDEVLGCNLPCEETPHLPIDPAANSLGDFCSDTPATPRNYACADPAGDSCSGAPWGTTDYTNFMGYGMDPQPCGNHFTDQQARRMHCWVCDALPGITLSGC